MPLVSEQERVAALGTYAVLDTGAEQAFDELTQLAASICEVPIALLSFVEGDRQWFKSCVGIAWTETPRALSFCAHAIEHDGPLIVSDALADARFAKNPLVTGPPGIRFYAGYPLIDESGAALGTLCVIDVIPRALTPLQHTAVAVLAKQVLAQLRLRRTTHMLGAEMDRREQGARARDQRQTAEILQARALREQVDLAHQRASFLADAGKLLAASLETDRTLEAVAVLSVPRFADLCSIVVCEEGDTLRRVADAALELDGAREMQRLREHPTGSGTGSLVAMRAAIERGEPLLFANYQEWLARRVLPDDAYLASVRRMEVTSAMSAPMIAGGRVLGVLSVAVQRRSARIYNDADVATLAELAQRAAMALENARLFAEAQRERARAEAANRSKDEFLAAVSHDLRTPLNAILGWAQLLRKPAAQPDRTMLARGLEVIERSARSQSRLIEDLLDLSRIVSGHLVFEQHPVDLLDVVGIALDTLRPAAAERGVELCAALDPAARDAVGDAGRLEQVVWNIVSNAIKFSRVGGRVDVHLRRVADGAELVVRDYGRGIDAELLPRIFDRFQQDDAGVGRRLGGLGLGLAIVKHIVEASGGRISAESAGIGHGARLAVWLPLVTGSTSPTSTA